MGSSEKRNSPHGSGFFLLYFILGAVAVESKCSRGCDLALASYYLWHGCNLTFISRTFSTTIGRILSFNPQITNKDYILADTRLNIPFPCDCINGEFLGHNFLLSAKPGANYSKVARIYFSNLVTVESLLRINSYDANFVANKSTQFNVTVNCSCGDGSVSKDYGLFVTYRLQAGENLSSVAHDSGLPLELLQRYNQDNLANNLVFIPGKDQYRNYPPLKSSGRGISSGIIIGVAVAVIAGIVLLVLCVYTLFHKRKTRAKASHLIQDGHGLGEGLKETPQSAPIVGYASNNLAAISINKAVEYSYKELAKATNNFGPAHKIGQGGFGAVFYAELRGERAAIKKMNMQATKEFLAELKVLTNVHHLNLVRLLGYCIEGSLFLIYEFIENGNLSEHLHRNERDPLPWSTRVRIALGSARGLEYIHEHTVPVYIHRDIKSANILLDKNFNAKVADFGLAKLTEVVGVSLNTRPVGTFGYMPPEYAQYGDVSPKIDVYAFGVVLYELISAMNAIVKTNETVTNSTGLIALFEDAFAKPDPLEGLHKLVDPRIHDDYPIDSVYKMATLARACTQENPHLRPSMRSAVVALMALLSSTRDWDIGTFSKNPALLNLMSAR